MTDPFAVLGLPARPDLTGDDIRAAWRRMAAATHPDRADGGDPARYAEAADAYTTLRTATGRGEAYADLAAQRPGRRLRPGGRLRRGRSLRPGGRLPHHGHLRRGHSLRPGGHLRPEGRLRHDGQLRRGRPGILAVRTAVAAAVSVGAVTVAGPQPASFALVAGAITWLARTGHRELAPPARPVTRSWFAPGRSRAARPSGTGGAGR